MHSRSTIVHGEEKGARIGEEFTIRTRFQEGHVFLRRGKRRKVWAARWRLSFLSALNLAGCPQHCEAKDPPHSTIRCKPDSDQLTSAANVHSPL